MHTHSIDRPPAAPQDRKPAGEVPDPPQPRLSKQDLATMTSCSVADIDRFVALGLIAPGSAEGCFARGDVSRVRLLLALIESGISNEQLAEAARTGRISVQFAGNIVADSAGLSGSSYRQALAETGVDAPLLRRVQLALGLPLTALEDPIREDDYELLTLVGRARGEGLPDEALLRLLRAFGLSLRNIVEAQRDLYRQNIEEPMLASGMPVQTLLETTAPMRVKLQRLGYRAVFLILRRFLEQAVFENVIARFEEILAAAEIARQDKSAGRTIAFIDMSNFTQRTEAVGDAQAAEESAQLLELVQDQCARFHGRLVKPLGDGVMLSFRQPAEATLCALEIVALAETAGLPPVRGGIAAGPVIMRDGDYFGQTVNVAARLVVAAPPRQIWTTDAVAATATGGSVAFRLVGPQMLKGLARPIPVWTAWRLTRGSS